MSNIITARFLNSRVTTAASQWQYDYGQILDVQGIDDLPSAFEAHFANTGAAKTVTQIGSDGKVAIPDECFLTGNRIDVYIYLHTGEDDGETEYHIIIPVQKRPKPTNETPTPVQQDAITEAIAALNNAVTQTSADVIATDASAQAAAVSEANALASEQAAKASETAAALSESNAADSAAQALASEQRASQSAADASLSAGYASRDADRAEQAAAKAGYLDVEIVDGRLIYTRTDAVDVNFTLDDGHLIMEAI